LNAPPIPSHACFVPLSFTVTLAVPLLAIVSVPVVHHALLADVTTVGVVGSEPPPPVPGEPPVAEPPAIPPVALDPPLPPPLEPPVDDPPVPLDPPVLLIPPPVPGDPPVPGPPPPVPGEPPLDDPPVELEPPVPLAPPVLPLPPDPELAHAENIKSRPKPKIERLVLICCLDARRNRD
jgi:hypothetical protein